MQIAPLFPLVYCLLPNKTFATYEVMLQALKELQPGRNPSCLMTYFEKGAMRAFQEAVAFLPPDDLEKVFDDLLSADGFDPRAQDIAKYFWDTYIGCPNCRGNRQSPLFPLDLWNMHLRTIEDEDRTNNQIEGFHRGFQYLIGAQVPNVFRFIEVLGKQQMLRETEVQQLFGGHNPPPKMKKYQCFDERIKSILINIGEITNCQALKGISFCPVLNDYSVDTDCTE